ncbi:hypothetical protein VP01_1587g5 [Puccinia sorghi]|uniref:Uncharacterized protein n=1 Tax=Puccinia sorghi TaxID=27349 RepID=A0A0L6VHK3_9BASI|nr:hypothetical protein VP01_1587g5 [Puccinia sorghi]
MSTKQSVRYSIPNFSNTMFATWKTQILTYCMEYNIDNYLLKDLAKPPVAEAEKLKLHESQRKKVAGILTCCMGQINNNQFVNDSNHSNPRKLWLLLTNHYESKAADNQSKVYQAFCNFKFSRDLSTFFDKLGAHLANMKSEHLQAKIYNTTTINLLESVIVKTESPLAATTIYCSNGTHNPATTHSKSKCWQLHPELKKSLQKPGKKQAKAAMAKLQCRILCA